MSGILQPLFSSRGGSILQLAVTDGSTSDNTGPDLLSDVFHRPLVTLSGRARSNAFSLPTGVANKSCGNMMLLTKHRQQLYDRRKYETHHLHSIVNAYDDLVLREGDTGKRAPQSHSDGKRAPHLNQYRETPCVRTVA